MMGFNQGANKLDFYVVFFSLIFNRPCRLHVWIAANP